MLPNDPVHVSPLVYEVLRGNLGLVAVISVLVSCTVLFWRQLIEIHEIIPCF
jgi:hypothetical protein